MSVDPLSLLATDRERAREEGDPMVDRCVLGSINRQGQVAQRTLVLRDIESRLALFYSASSAKYHELHRANRPASLLVLLPSIGIQYRIQAELTAMPRTIVESHWEFKPNAAKRMDAVYERFPQSTVVEDLEQLDIRFDATVAPVKAPRNCTGCFIEPFEIERLLLRTDPHRHERKLYTLRDSAWTVKDLVP